MFICSCNSAAVSKHYLELARRGERGLGCEGDANKRTASLRKDFTSWNKADIHTAKGCAGSQQMSWKWDFLGGSGSSKAGATTDINHFFKIKAQTITPMRAEGTSAASRRGHVSPVTIATYSLTSSPMKHRFRSSPAHSCTPTMPKMKKTKKHSASTLPSIGSVSKRRVTRMRMPTNTHRRQKKKEKCSSRQQAPDASLC